MLLFETVLSWLSPVIVFKIEKSCYFAVTLVEIAVSLYSASSPVEIYVFWCSAVLIFKTSLLLFSALTMFKIAIS